MRTVPLHTSWTLAPAPEEIGFVRPQLLPFRPIPFQAPGSIYDALVEAEIIAYPLHGLAEIGSQWVAEQDWNLDCSFVFEAKHQTQIFRIETLDTFAKVFVNEKIVGEHENCHLPFEADITSALHPGLNHLRIELKSPIKIGMERRKRWVEEQGLAADTTYLDERAFIRKPGCHFGWDWGPRLAAGGIFGEVAILDFDDRITDFEVSSEAVQDGWFEIRATANCTSGAGFDFSLEGHESQTQLEVLSKSLNEIVWRVKGKLWWPNGMGEQPLYTVRAHSDSGQIAEKKIGLRTIELRQEPDEFGTSFQFFVNGEPVWARGANVIPFSPISPSMGRGAGLLRKSKSIGFNMVRIWGGGTYISEEMADLCDELGLLVWQDFPFACMYYPDSPEWQEIIREEAEFHVKRLAHRASLAMWCGSNETAVMHQTGWNVGGSLPPRYLGEPLYDQVLPSAVEHYSPHVPYIPSSPFGSLEGGPWSDERVGTSHYWEAWHGKGDWIHYGSSRARMSSEFGFASAPSLGACHQMGAHGNDFPSAALLHHDKTGKSFSTFLGFVTEHYPEPTNLIDWIYYSQLNQRDAMRFAIEHYRRSECCKGTLIWQLNDIWPAQSWSLFDSNMEAKPAAFELERLYADLVICIHQTSDKEAEIWLANDSNQLEKGILRMESYDSLTVDALESKSFAFEVQPYSRLKIATKKVQPEAVCRSIHKASIEGQPKLDRWFFLCEPKALQLNLCPIVQEGNEFSVSAPVIDAVIVCLNPHFYPLTAGSCDEWNPKVWLPGRIELPNEPNPQWFFKSLAGKHEIEVKN